MLFFTSFLFGPVALHACIKKKYFTSLLYMLQYGFSVLHHANYTNTDYLGGSIVAFTDKLLAKINYLRGALMIIKKRDKILYTTIVYIPVVYYTNMSKDCYKPYQLDSRVMWHASIHVCASIVMHRLLSIS